MLTPSRHCEDCARAAMTFLRVACQEMRCAVCLGPWRHPVLVDGCGHVFCKECLDRCSAAECPLCKRRADRRVMCRIPLLDDLVSLAKRLGTAYDIDDITDMSQPPNSHAKRGRCCPDTPPHLPLRMAKNESLEHTVGSTQDDIELFAPVGCSGRQYTVNLEEGAAQSEATQLLAPNGSDKTTAVRTHNNISARRCGRPPSGIGPCGRHDSALAARSFDTTQMPQSAAYAKTVPLNHAATADYCTIGPSDACVEAKERVLDAPSSCSEKELLRVSSDRQHATAAFTLPVESFAHGDGGCAPVAHSGTASSLTPWRRVISSVHGDSDRTPLKSSRPEMVNGNGLSPSSSAPSSVAHESEHTEYTAESAEPAGCCILCGIDAHDRARVKALLLFIKQHDPSPNINLLMALRPSALERLLGKLVGPFVVGTRRVRGHYQCLLSCSGVRETPAGLQGNIAQAIQEALRSYCEFCGGAGATHRCAQSKRHYHLSCALLTSESICTCEILPEP